VDHWWSMDHSMRNTALDHRGQLRLTVFYMCVAATYEIGTPVPNTPCSFTVNATSKKQGTILSPTYPGAYPKDLSCNYQFLGSTGQRIRIEFRDFDLFFGGPQYVFCEYISDWSIFLLSKTQNFFNLI
jgi:hypothetical protein